MVSLNRLGLLIGVSLLLLAFSVSCQPEDPSSTTTGAAHRHRQRRYWAEWWNRPTNTHNRPPRADSGADVNPCA